MYMYVYSYMYSYSYIDIDIIPNSRILVLAESRRAKRGLR